MSPPFTRRLVEGPFQPVLEEALVAAFDGHRGERGPLAPAILLVGSNVLGLYLTRLLAHRLGGVGGARVVTFLDLARSISAAALRRERLRPLPPAGDRLQARLLADALPADSYFAAIARTEGFEEALLATLRDLREGGIAADRLRASFPADHRKASDLARLQENYEAALAAARLYDAPALMTRALAALAGDGSAALPPEAPLFVYGFYDLTWVQERIVLRLAERLATTFFLPHRDTPAFEFASPLRARLRAAGFARADVSAPEDGRDRGRLAARVFVPVSGAGAVGAGRTAAADDGSVRIVAAPGETREVIEAARYVLDWARRGVPFEEMAILYRSAEPYLPLVQEQLARVGVPCFSPETPRGRRSRTARALACLLEIKRADHERQGVIEFLTLARLDAAVLDQGTLDGTPPASPPHPADWDLVSRMAGIVSGRASWDPALKRLESRLEAAAGQARVAADAGPPPDPRLAVETRRLRRLHARLARGLDGLPDEGAWERLADAVARLIRTFEAPGPDRDATLEVIRGLAALGAVSPRVTLAEFRRLLESELDAALPSDGHFQRGHLFVGSVQAARGLGFRAVVILGLTEQAFPPPSRQDPILLDPERRRVAETVAGVSRIAYRTDRIQEERLLFTLAASAARDTLVLTWPRLDAQGTRERLPSPYLLRTVEALDGVPCDYRRLAGRVTRIALTDLVPVPRARAASRGEFDLSVVAEGVRERDPARALFPAIAPDTAPFFARGVAFEEQRWGRADLTPVDGVLRDPAARALLAERHGLAGVPVSATRLEQYMGCPFQYFGVRILGLAPLEAPEAIERLSPLDRGTLMHAILHELFATLRADGDLPLRAGRRAAAVERLRAIVARRCAEADARGIMGAPLLRTLETRRIEEDLRRFLDREIEAADDDASGGWTPSHFEVRFGMPKRRAASGEPSGEDPLSTDAPVPLPIGAGALTFKGQIDRIDLSADGTRARVVDYKSGSLDRYPEDSLAAGTALQAPVYMLAAEALLRGVRVDSAVYLSVARRGGFESRTIGRSTWTSLLDDLRLVGRLVEDGIARGRFFIHPEERRCRECTLGPLCGEARETRFARKRADPVLRDFLAFTTRSST